VTLGLWSPDRSAIAAAIDFDSSAGRRRDSDIRQWTDVSRI